MFGAKPSWLGQARITDIVTVCLKQQTVTRDLAFSSLAVALAQCSSSELIEGQQAKNFSPKKDITKKILATLSPAIIPPYNLPH